MAAPSTASAHTIDQAVAASDGCAWGDDAEYLTLHSDLIQTSAGEILGTGFLLWSGTFQENCVVTLKAGAAHGVSTWTEAQLHTEDGSTWGDAGAFGHYAAVYAPTGGQCVAYTVVITSPSGEEATGGRPEFANCSRL
ncbi:hypothetical protein [Streptomyces sp. SBT349]|uniref:hypothetical protein n=1 Tax=Streptomyces sp. SBT349 TaxID=1580539 RepID=UPI00066CA4E3|nr:hypothetical protein [Streptomyces sp. SBT349]